jgi:hypothetical protein
VLIEVVAVAREPTAFASWITASWCPARMGARRMLLSSHHIRYFKRLGG